MGHLVGKDIYRILGKNIDGMEMRPLGTTSCTPSSRSSIPRTGPRSS